MKPLALSLALSLLLASPSLADSADPGARLRFGEPEVQRRGERVTVTVEVKGDEPGPVSCVLVVRWWREGRMTAELKTAKPRTLRLTSYRVGQTEGADRIEILPTHCYVPRS